MARYRVTFEFEGSRIDAVKKKMQELMGDDGAARVEKRTNPTSRNDRYSEAESDFENAKIEVEMLRDELQEWKDNLPENLQDGTKADEIQSAIDSLEDVLNSLENVSFDAVDFPSMF